MSFASESVAVATSLSFALAVLDGASAASISISASSVASAAFFFFLVGLASASSSAASSVASATAFFFAAFFAGFTSSASSSSSAGFAVSSVRGAFAPIILRVSTGRRPEPTGSIEPSMYSSTPSSSVASLDLDCGVRPFDPSLIETESISFPLEASRTATVRTLWRPSSWIQPSITASTPELFAAFDHTCGPCVFCMAAARASSQRFVEITS